MPGEIFFFGFFHVLNLIFYLWFLLWCHFFLMMALALKVWELIWYLSRIMIEGRRKEEG